jgi:hypothetical protein
MKRKLFDFSDWMLVSLVFWICLLPILLYFALPFLGKAGTGLLAIGILIALLAACWVACGRTET